MSNELKHGSSANQQERSLVLACKGVLRDVLASRAKALREEAENFLLHGGYAVAQFKFEACIIERYLKGEYDEANTVETTLFDGEVVTNVAHVKVGKRYCMVPKLDGGSHGNSC